jgi:hypothetical protein
MFKTIENVDKLNDLLISTVSKRLNTKGCRKYYYNVFKKSQLFLIFISTIKSIKTDYFSCNCFVFVEIPFIFSSRNN